ALRSKPMLSRTLKAASVALALIVAGRANATSVYSDTVLAHGSEFLTTIELPVTTGATYRVTLKDLNWFGAPMEALNFGIFTAPGRIMPMQSVPPAHPGAGAFEFFTAAPGKVFLQIYARPIAPRFAGLIGVDCDVAVVGLPSSILLLLSGLAG